MSIEGALTASRSEAFRNRRPRSGAAELARTRSHLASRPKGFGHRAGAGKVWKEKDKKGREEEGIEGIRVQCGLNRTACSHPALSLLCLPSSL
jgi:hypothetical protein